MKYGVYGFPTVKLFVDQAVFEFSATSGDRSWRGILSFLKQHLQRDHVLNNVTELKTFLAEHDTAAVLISDGKDAVMNKEFQRVENHYEEVSFAR